MILLMGIAGSGKGTQGKLLAEKLGYDVISTGEMLRTYGTEDQHNRMRTGEILHDEEVTKLLDQALHQLKDQNKVILDGYPRRTSQAEWLLNQSTKGRFNLEAVLHLNASTTVVRDRLKKRDRMDDSGAAVENRFLEHGQITIPILSHLTAAGIPIINIDAEGSPEEVHNQVMNSLTSNLAK